MIGFYNNLPNDDNIPYEDEEDLWDESFYSYYDSPLERVNELAFFKEGMIKLKENQSQLYEALLKLIPQKELENIDKKLEKAIHLMGAWLDFK